jgi:hypothetical protein
VTRSRVQTLILALLVIVGVAIVVMRWPSSTVDDAGAPLRTGAGQAARQDETVGDIRLESLEQRGQGPSTPTRDLFRFESRRVASAAPAEGRPRAANPAPVATGPPAPTGPPPPPPIPLRYIGYLDQPGQVPRVAVLSDGRGNVFNGKEGDIIEGRYRVLRIGTDSADLIYVDGRGRQTIRLSGQ